MSVYVAPIVEGKTEQKNDVRALLVRVWYELFGQSENLEVLEAVRGDRGILGNPTRGAEIAAKIREAHLGLRDAITYDNDPAGGRGVILLLLDADRECPKSLGPAILKAAQDHCPHLGPFACVLAVQMFENWLIAGAAGFTNLHALDLPSPLSLPDDPEAVSGASWFTRQRQNVSRGTRTYRKTADAVRFIHAMDLAEAHRTSRSFRKLCRELQKLTPPTVAPPPDPPDDTQT